MTKLTKLVSSVAVIAGLGLSASAVAGGYHRDYNNLPAQDQFVKTVIDKSVISGQVRRDNNGNIVVVVDDNGGMHVLFDYKGTVHSVDTNDYTGELKKLSGTIGTIEGTAQFPMAFAQGSMAMKAFLDGVGPQPMFPAVIDWTCADCTMKVNGVTYKGIKTDGQGLDGRAFTGLGPVEVGAISQYSMTVRLAGCSAVAGDDNTVGTLCMNSSLTFDLAGIDLTPGNEMQSVITGEGTSNCTTVLQPAAQ